VFLTGQGGGRSGEELSNIFPVDKSMNKNYTIGNTKRSMR